MVEPRDPLNDSWELPLARPTGKRFTVGGFLRSRFLTGLVVAFPLVFTLFLGRFLFDLIDRWADPISRELFGRVVPGVGAAVFLLVIFCLGILGHNVLGRRVLKLGDRILERVPVLRPVYKGAREVTRAFGRDRTKGFRRVVLIPFPGPGVWSIGFLTGEFEAATEGGSEPMCAVFMPTTPNPTTGFYMIYPRSTVRDTTLSVEEAIRMVISGGLVASEQPRIFASARPLDGGPR